MNYKNICLQIKTRENFTDPRFTEFMQGWNFTDKEFDRFLNTIWDSISNEYSRKIIDFIINYKNGILVPDKCDTYEPIRGIFDKSNITDQVRWLSSPAGSLLLKKKHKFHMEIVNETFTAVYQNGKLLKPIVLEPEYLGKITFWFSKHRKIDMIFLEELLTDLCEYLGSDNGIIFDEETDEIILDIFRVDT